MSVTLTRRGFLEGSLGFGVVIAAERLQHGEWLLSDWEQLRVGVVGLGRCGHKYLEVLAAIPCARVIALAGNDSVSLRIAARCLTDARAEAPRLTLDTRSLLDDRSVDVVVLAAPTQEHPGLLARASTAGKSVFLGQLSELPFGDRRHDVRTVSTLVRTELCAYADSGTTWPVTPQAMKSRIGTPHGAIVHAAGLAPNSAISILPAASALDLALRAVVPERQARSALAAGMRVERDGVRRVLHVLDHSIEINTHTGPGKVPMVELHGSRGQFSMDVPDAPSSDIRAAQLVEFLHLARYPVANANLTAERSLFAAAMAATLREAR